MSILIGVSIVKHPFGTPSFRNSNVPTKTLSIGYTGEADLSMKFLVATEVATLVDASRIRRPAKGLLGPIDGNQTWIEMDRNDAFLTFPLLPEEKADEIRVSK